MYEERDEHLEAVKKAVSTIKDEDARIAVLSWDRNFKLVTLNRLHSIPVWCGEVGRSGQPCALHGCLLSYRRWIENRKKPLSEWLRRSVHHQGLISHQVRIPLQKGTLFPDHDAARIVEDTGASFGFRDRDTLHCVFQSEPQTPNQYSENQERLDAIARHYGGKLCDRVPYFATVGRGYILSESRKWHDGTTAVYTAAELEERLEITLTMQAAEKAALSTRDAAAGAMR